MKHQYFNYFKSNKEMLTPYNSHLVCNSTTKLNTILNSEVTLLTLETNIGHYYMLLIINKTKKSDLYNWIH